MAEDTTSPLELEATRFDSIAAELDRASAHCRTAAAHYRDRDVPRAAAHAWAASGHVAIARRELVANSIEHAAHASPERRDPASPGG